MLIGATTIKGTLWRAASTAALYVPICVREDQKIRRSDTHDGCVHTLFAVSPLRAILSAPTATIHLILAVHIRTVKVLRLLADGVNVVMLEEGSYHRVDNHCGRYFKRLEF